MTVNKAEFNKKVINDIKSYLSGREELEASYIFGSRASENYDKTSDFDIGIITSPAMDKIEAYNFKLMLEDELIRKFGVEFDVVLFSNATIKMKHKIISGKLLTGKESKYRVTCEVKTIRKYLDMKPYYQTYFANRGGRFGEGE